MDNINNPRSSDQGSSYYEEVKVVDDKNDSHSWA